MGYSDWGSVFTEQYMIECSSNISVEIVDHLDYSIESTMRGLLFSRTKEAVNWTMWRSTMRSAVEHWRLQHFVEVLRPGINMACGFNDESISIAEKYFSGLTDGWKVLNKAEIFLNKRVKNGRVLFFINEAQKKTVVITGKISPNTLHTLVAGIPVYLPWYFSERPVDTDEKNLLSALLDNNMTAFIDAANVIAEKIGLYKVFVEQSLKDFEKKVDKIALQKANNELDTIDRNLTQLYDRMKVLLDSRRTQEYIISGIHASNRTESEIMQYFMSNKNIKLLNTYDTMFSFSVTGQLSFWDVEQAKAMLVNDRSVFYECGDHDRIKRLMNAVLVDQTISIRFSSAYTIDIRGQVMGERTMCTVGGYMPNPHIIHFECLGDYKRLIMGLIADKDFIGAIDQCIASAMSLNVGDYAVMQHFIQDLGLYGQVFVLPDGELVDLSGAYKYLEGSES